MRRSRVGPPHPFVRLAGIIQAEIVVDRLRGKHRREPLRQRLQAVERAVAADGDQPVDVQPLQASGDEVEFSAPVGIDVVPGRADQGATLRRVKLGNALKERVQMNMRNAGIEETVKSLDKTVEFDFQLIGPNDRTVNRGIKSGSVASCSKDPNPFHCI